MGRQSSWSVGAAFALGSALIALASCTSAPSPRVSPTPPRDPAHRFSITSPADGTSLTDQVVMVSGTGHPAAEILIDQPIPPHERRTTVDTCGRWRVEVALSEGEHVLRVVQRLRPETEEARLRVAYEPIDTWPLRVEIFDVGLGESILIRGPDSTVLIDGGRPEARVVDELRARGVRRIDLVVATHSHNDHMGGLVDVVGSMPVGRVAYNGTGGVDEPPRDFLAAVERSGAVYLEPKRGDVLTAGSLRFGVLNPPSKHHGDENDNSIVLSLRYGSVRFLFTGDIERQGRRDLLAAGVDLGADVLKLAHHGKADAGRLRFIQAVAPEIGVYSDAPDSPSELPRELEERGIRVYGTDRHGDILIATDGERTGVQPQRGSAPIVLPPPAPSPSPVVTTCAGIIGER